MTKPDKVEVGQRWRYKAVEYTVIEQHGGDGARWRLRWDDNGKKSACLYSDADTMKDTFLGYAPGYGPQEAKEPGGWVVGSRWQQWDISDAIYRVVRVEGGRAVVVWEKAPGDEPEQVGTIEFDAKRWQFRGWAAPKAEEPTPTPAPKTYLGPVLGPADPRYGTEMRAAGQPLSARAIIEMRDRLPKPEPWVESCDPLHWIPDA